MYLLGKGSRIPLPVMTSYTNATVLLHYFVPFVVAAERCAY